MLRLTESEKNEILSLMNDFIKTRETSLLPVVNEVIASLELGQIEDAYQARYIRDAIYLNEENKEKYKDLESKLVEKYFA